MLRAQSPTKAPQLLAASGVAVSCTASTNEEALATVTIPAGAMGLNGGIEVRTVWTTTNSANTKSLRGRLGGIAGSAFMAIGLTTLALVTDARRFRNRNSASSQICSANIASPVGGFGGTTSAVTTMAVDTSVAVDLVITGQKTSAGETITLESYEVWLLPA